MKKIILVLGMVLLGSGLFCIEGGFKVNTKYILSVRSITVGPWGYIAVSFNGQKDLLLIDIDNPLRKEFLAILLSAKATNSIVHVKTGKTPSGEGHSQDGITYNFKIITELSLGEFNLWKNGKL